MKIVPEESAGSKRAQERMRARHDGLPRESRPPPSGGAKAVHARTMWTKTNLQW
jgi:hypothetical protein